MRPTTWKAGVATIAVGVFLGLTSTAFAVVNPLTVTDIDPETVNGGSITFPDGGTATVKRSEECEEDELKNDDDECPKTGFYFESDQTGAGVPTVLPDSDQTGVGAVVVLNLAGGGSVTGTATMGANGLAFTPDRGAPAAALPDTGADMGWHGYGQVGGRYLSKPSTTLGILEMGDGVESELMMREGLSIPNHGANVEFGGGVRYNSPDRTFGGARLRFDAGFFYDSDGDEVDIPEFLTNGYDFGIPHPGGNGGDGDQAFGYVFRYASGPNTLSNIQARSKQHSLSGDVALTALQLLNSNGALIYGLGVGVTRTEMKADVMADIPFFAVNIYTKDSYENTAINPHVNLGWNSPKSNRGMGVSVEAYGGPVLNLIDVEQEVTVSQNGIVLGMGAGGSGELGGSSPNKVGVNYGATVTLHLPKFGGMTPELLIGYQGGELPKLVADGIDPVTAKLSHFDKITAALRLWIF